MYIKLSYLFQDIGDFFIIEGHKRTILQNLLMQVCNHNIGT